MSASGHAELLGLLLPKPYDPASNDVLAASLTAEGDALDAAHDAADVVAEAISPAGGDGLWLADWERVLGLPDACAGGYGQTQSARIAAALAKLRASAGLSRAAVIATAKALGFEITIEEYSVYTCESACDAPICDAPWRFVFTVHAPSATVRDFTCASGCDEPLASWGNSALECVIKRLKPAHTFVIFSYGD